jgi:ribosomal protein S18 acetylase RimI-like enzyme
MWSITQSRSSALEDGGTNVSSTRDVLLRDASPEDAAAIAAIGMEAVPAQYAGLIDPAVIAAAVSQTYAPSAIADCIERCRVAEDASFLVAERSNHVVGFLHFDAFGPEPELHRLYLDHRHRGAGVGSMLMDGLHERVPADLAYMLLVVAGNDGAVRFYRRHGLRIERTVDGLEYYSERMGVVFPTDAPPVRLILMRRRVSG